MSPETTQKELLIPPHENSALTFFSSIPEAARAEKWKEWEGKCRGMSDFTRGALQEMVGAEVLLETDRVVTTPEQKEMAEWFLRTGIGS